jgi:hypothetical protein
MSSNNISALDRLNRNDKSTVDSDRYINPIKSFVKKSKFLPKMRLKTKILFNTDQIFILQKKTTEYL